MTLEPKGFHEIGPDQVAIETVMRAVGGSSGIETTQEVVMVVALRDRKMVRIDFATSLEEASARPPGLECLAPAWHLRRRRRSTSAAGMPPSRRICQPPPISSPVTSTTVEGSPVSSPPSIARSAPPRCLGGTSSNRAARARR